MGKLIITKVGLQATIQDEGRFGYRQYGIPQSGAMDLEALHHANLLLGNQKGFPAIEIAMQGISLKALEDTLISVTGAEVNITIEGRKVETNTAHSLQKGEILNISRTSAGVYYYIGIAGKIRANKEFESYSTYTMAKLGGIDGEVLKEADILETDPAMRKQPAKAVDPNKVTAEIQEIRILKGPEWRMLKDLPDQQIFQIHPSSNRMGIRLNGRPLGIDGLGIASSAVVPGTIQLPSNGLPIILMNDCQTTGGYPRIGKVIDKDLGKLSQVRPGSQIRFRVLDEPTDQ